MPVNSENYAAFLPCATWSQPRSTWWDWRGRRVHIARSDNASADVRMIGIHGAGGYSGALWPLAALISGDDVELAFPDLPLYGGTIEPDPARVRYETWLELLCDLVAAEHRHDDRPLVLFGASMGGMLAYEVAARTRLADAVVATCLLDPSDADARAAAARFRVAGRYGPTVLRPLDRVVGQVRVPIKWLVNMRRMSANHALSRLCATDPKGGGTRVPIGLLASYLTFQHTRPETFDAAPVTLVHPAADQWTPPELSIRFLERIAGPTSLVLLEGCGHFPIEEPGVTQLATALRAVRDGLLDAR
ncbi:alpha/beta hydrolase [Haloechinothrix salitolerans]